MRKIYTDLRNLEGKSKNTVWRAAISDVYNIQKIRTLVQILSISQKFRNLLLGFFYWLLAHKKETPGLDIHRRIEFIILSLFLKRRIDFDSTYRMMIYPLDTVRYFEFDFMWKFLQDMKSGRYLDVSSPRFLLIISLMTSPEVHADIVNPDISDLSITRDLVSICGLERQCRFHNIQAENMPFDSESFDVITSMSVLEHIPADGDCKAIRKMWEVLKKGGRLIISVPCAKEAFEEYINVDFYGLYNGDEQGYVFGQRFYDQIEIEKRVFDIVGKPARFSVYGEKQAGVLTDIRRNKIYNSSYSYWKEPYLMGKLCKTFSSI
ncbi:class I SAM-dependent methyltransferase, partial [bacterium]|nr:class I SAM-dependent methyltransferase [bacterium]